METVRKSILLIFVLAAAVLSSACQMGRGADRESGNWRSGTENVPETTAGDRGAVGSNVR